MLKRFVYSYLFLLLPLILNATDTITIQGKVRHANNYDGIPFVSIYLENHPIGATSDEQGKFVLEIPDSLITDFLVFQHISFDTLRIPLNKVLEKDDFYLIPRIIPSGEITVEALRNQPEILADLPQSYSVITAKRFEQRGYTDAADLLATDQTVQVEEALSGKKAVILRAGNPDDVTLLYNGVRLRNAYDNVYDFSLISLADVQQIELIRGSNSSLYGPEAFSGVINIVPRKHRSYNLRFQQRIGSYSSGDWNVQLNYNVKKRLNLSYSYQKGAYKRFFLSEDTTAEESYLNNKSAGHNASIVYDFSDNENDGREQSLSLLFLQNEADYKNNLNNDALDRMNRLVSARLAGLWDFYLTTSYQWLQHDQYYATDLAFWEQRFKSRLFSLRAEKRLTIKMWKLLVAYQYEKARLNFENNRAQNDYESYFSGDFFQNQHGLVGIIKWQLPKEKGFISMANLDVSYRYDRVSNDNRNVVQKNGVHLFDASQKPTWSASTLRFSSHFKGETRFFLVNAYMNIGSNIKFPTLFQMLSIPQARRFNPQATQPYLSPEKNRSMEIGLGFLRENTGPNSINGWEISFNYFQNYYDNKFRIYYRETIPAAYFDNVQNANIFGLDGKVKLFMVKSKVIFEFGFSKYFISDKSAFPFKSDAKIIANMMIEHAGFNGRIHAFYKSGQTGWVMGRDDVFYEIPLPGYTNLDAHIGKNFELGPIKLFANFSVRNLFDDKTLLSGLALRDRRFYLTFGVQY